MARTAEMEITDLAVRLEDSGLSHNSARREAERIAAVIRADGFEQGYGEAKRKVLVALTGKEV